MSTLSVLLLCSNAFRVRRFSRILAASGFARVQVVSQENDWTQFPPELGELDLVICDSLHSVTAIYYLRRLCEHYGFFSMIECEALEAPIRWGLANFRVRSGKYCVGSYSDLDTVQISGLLLKALTVKRTVKNHSRSRLAADRRAPASNDWRAQLDVAQALEQQQIVAYFQPQVCLKTRRITGAEVLARWQHPHRGVLGPQSFLDLVDSPERHRQLFDCLLQQGLMLQRQLQAHTQGDALVFSYNIEASQLTDPEFAAQMLLQVEEAGVPKKQVTLEITERQALVLDMQSIENISVLVKGGVRLSLDDFGTGHSSIMRLVGIPFGQIKLDSGFVANALGLKETRIIEAVVGLARSLNLELVAEGVETEKQRAHLQRLGVDAAQGYLFHKPMRGQALLQVLNASHAPLRLIRQG
ncbi:EAL domain-containing protein [Pseudomonas protegens]|uniref:EAL domain-containing protein n=1 Tax=Pseudomonas protegens TaxID=380021 RepID=UPI00275906A0|nr:EAL domain-containing protein [Pseudomonas protegens]MDP9534657.1 EAL domain-containing protein [Pseudomonas protegens]